MAKPLLNVLFSKNLGLQSESIRSTAESPFSDAWAVSLELIVYANNPDYMRMNALLRLSGGGYRQDYIAGNITSHIVKGNNITSAIAKHSDGNLQNMKNPSRNWEIHVLQIGGNNSVDDHLLISICCVKLLGIFPWYAYAKPSAPNDTRIFTQVYLYFSRCTAPSTPL